jgi:hypothetical protein
MEEQFPPSYLKAKHYHEPEVYTVYAVLPANLLDDLLQIYTGSWPLVLAGQRLLTHTALSLCHHAAAEGKSGQLYPPLVSAFFDRF